MALGPPTDEITQEQITRVNQVYRAYLDAWFEIDQNQKRHDSLSDRSKHIDFLIALGAAASGGSGLGILAEPQLAWLCGILTTISTLGAIAKGTYDWSGRLNTFIELIKVHTIIFHAGKRLQEDIQAQQTWSEDFQKRFDELRDMISKLPLDTSKQLPIADQREIQNEVRRKSNCATWWNWRSS